MTAPQLHEVISTSSRRLSAPPNRVHARPVQRDVGRSLRLGSAGAKKGRQHDGECNAKRSAAGKRKVHVCAASSSIWLGLQLPRQHDMHHTRRRNVLGATIAELWRIETGQEMFARSEERRGNRGMHLIDQACMKVLPDRRAPAAQPYVSFAGGVGRPPKRRVDAVGDEVEGRAAAHRERSSRVMCKYEDRHVKGWV